MAKAGVEVDAVVVVKGQDRVFRVGTVVVLLARVVLPVGRAGWVDPDLARWVLEAQLTREHTGHPVAAVDNVEEATADLLVHIVGKGAVTGARHTKGKGAVDAVIQALVQVHGSQHGHGGTERVTRGRYALVVELLLELDDLLVDFIPQFHVGVAEASKQLNAFAVRRCHFLRRINQSCVHIVQDGKQTGGRAFKAHRHTQRLGMEDLDTLDYDAMSLAPQYFCIADTVTNVAEQTVGLVGHTRCLRENVPVDRQVRRSLMGGRTINTTGLNDTQSKWDQAQQKSKEAHRW